jgi:hypothetical protein
MSIRPFLNIRMSSKPLMVEQAVFIDLKPAPAELERGLHPLKASLQEHPTSAAQFPFMDLT